jgi:hypothetical protein
MIVVVDSLFLLALLAAFVGLVSFVALPGTRRASGVRRGVVTAVAVCALFLYGLSRHESARRMVYGAALPAAR